MEFLFSLPPNLAKNLDALSHDFAEPVFGTADPEGVRVGSGGGTAWLLSQCWKHQAPGKNFPSWLAQEKRVLIHAGGKSRRLPAYAPLGKLFAPIPVFRWSRGQSLTQSLLDLQAPLYKRILSEAPKTLNTLIASGDVYIHHDGHLGTIPDADVVCFGLWVEPELASHHGVFVCQHNQPEQLEYMLQKPDVSRLQELASSHLYLMDIGIWLLSDKAIQRLMKKSGYTDGEAPFQPGFYDLYSEFGPALGNAPKNSDADISDLTVRILPLEKGEFYHFGTSKELISSTLAIQNRINDQRTILHKDRKPHPSLFVQNARVQVPLQQNMQNLWIENSSIGEKWQLQNNHIITGVPENDWELSLPPGLCVDVVPIGDHRLCLRPYHMEDKFSGAFGDPQSVWLGKPLADWFADREIDLMSTGIPPETDIQDAPLFPLLTIDELNSSMLNWMIHGSDSQEARQCWLQAERLSASEISDTANLQRMQSQREAFRKENWPLIRKNHAFSVFHQLNLDHAAREFARFALPVSDLDPAAMAPQTQMAEYMFKARVKQYLGEEFETSEAKAFATLQKSILQNTYTQPVLPRLNVHPDQIVWGRSPVRIDLAGGWSDTPPYCMFQGGKVVNVAINLNGQPPLQTYIKPSSEKQIILRSIDLGQREVISNWDELKDFYTVGSPFSIPKAALCLAGFHPDFSGHRYGSLKEQLDAFGAGIEITMLAAIPKGSGLGTSSALAATVLGTLSEFCGLNWSHEEIGTNTLSLEQLLTTGGGWQDQFGAVLPGIKLLETQAGFQQTPSIKWAPSHLFTRVEYTSCMLLYYTGITRTAKSILAEIVRGMFLNNATHLEILDAIKQHASDTFEVLQQNDFNRFADCINKTWTQNQHIDKGTNTPEIQKIIDMISDLSLALKLPGAGGGGYMYIIAKDPVAAVKIKQRLTQNPPNKNARFVDLELSETGFQVTKS